MKLLDNLKFFVETAKDTSKTNTDLHSATQTILIVDDEISFAEPLELKLKAEGYKVIRASNGSDGLQMAISYNPNLIILDILMPIMDGKTMLRKLREYSQFKKLPVIMLSNEGEITNIKETEIYYGASKFLIKAIVSIDDITNEVKNMLKTPA